MLREPLPSLQLRATQQESHIRIEIALRCHFAVRWAFFSPLLSAKYAWPLTQKKKPKAKKLLPFQRISIKTTFTCVKSAPGQTHLKIYARAKYEHRLLKEAGDGLEK